MRVLIAFLLLFINNLYAQEIIPSSDTCRGGTIGYSRSAVSIKDNPGMLTYLNSDFISAGYVKYYNPSFFYSFNIAYANKLNKNGAAAILWRRYNSSDNVEYFDYSENQFHVAYGHNIGSIFRPGAVLNVLNIDTDSGSAMGYGISISLLFVPVPDYFITLAFDNVISSKFRWTTDLEDDALRNTAVGLGYKVLLWKFETIFSMDYRINDIKFEKYVISDYKPYEEIKGGMSMSYKIIDLSVGFIKNQTYNLMSGCGVGIVDKARLGINYLNNSNGLGGTTGVYIECRN